MLDGGSAFNHTLKRLQPFTFAGEQPVRAQLSDGQMSMDFNIMTRRDRCQAKVRVADRTFTTFASRGGVVFVLSGAWQLGDKLLTDVLGANLSGVTALMVEPAGGARTPWQKVLHALQAPWKHLAGGIHRI